MEFGRIKMGNKLPQINEAGSSCDFNMVRNHDEQISTLLL